MDSFQVSQNWFYRGKWNMKRDLYVLKIVLFLISNDLKYDIPSTYKDIYYRDVHSQSYIKKFGYLQCQNSYGLRFSQMHEDKKAILQNQSTNSTKIVHSFGRF